jgi:hypothetical protein
MSLACLSVPKDRGLVLVKGSEVAHAVGECECRMSVVCVCVCVRVPHAGGTRVSGLVGLMVILAHAFHIFFPS